MKTLFSKVYEFYRHLYGDGQFLPTPYLSLQNLVPNLGELYDRCFRVEVLPAYEKFTKVYRGPGGGTPYNGLNGEAPQERGTLSRLEVYKGIGISQVEVQKRAGKTRYYKGISKYPEQTHLTLRYMKGVQFSLESI